MITIFANNNANYPALGYSGAPCIITQSIIAQPNQSASWQTNKQLILCLGIFSGVIATVFGLLGAWLILPLAGIEITALSGALYVVCRKQNLRHVLHFSGDQLVIEKGINHPEQVWQSSKQSTSIIVERQAHPWDPIKISLTCFNGAVVEQISVGDFLNKEDSQQLLEVLRQQGLIVRNDSVSGQIDL
ncbi:MAG: DUF2244 domain-containing protein [Pseudomonadales bacterium]